MAVEDDPMVRNDVIAQLGGFGYPTIAAENAAEALAVVHTARVSICYLPISYAWRIGRVGARQGSEEIAAVREGAVYVRLYGQRDRASGAP